MQWHTTRRFNRGRALAQIKANCYPLHMASLTRFVCVVALAERGKILGTCRGVVEGQMLDAPRGHDGFGPGDRALHALGARRQHERRAS